MTEPVSPELALIDPDLRHRLLGSESVWPTKPGDLKERAGGLPSALDATPDGERDRGARSKPPRAPAARVAIAALKIAALVAVTIAVTWTVLRATDDNVAVSTAAAPPTARQVPPTRTAALRSRPASSHVSTTKLKTTARRVKPRVKAPSLTGARELAHVERAILALLPSAARAGRAPRSLLDPSTGLLRDGTMIDCVLRHAGLYRCSISAGTASATLTAQREASGAISLGRVSR